jgi:hypothetical protein
LYLCGFVVTADFFQRGIYARFRAAVYDDLCAFCCERRSGVPAQARNTT